MWEDFLFFSFLKARRRKLCHILVLLAGKILLFFFKGGPGVRETIHPTSPGLSLTLPVTLGAHPLGSPPGTTHTQGLDREPRARGSEQRTGALGQAEPEAADQMVSASPPGPIGKAQEDEV